MKNSVLGICAFLFCFIKVNGQELQNVVPPLPSSQAITPTSTKVYKSYKEAWQASRSLMGEKKWDDAMVAFNALKNFTKDPKIIKWADDGIKICQEKKISEALTPTVTLHGQFPIDFEGEIGKTQMRLQEDLDKLVIIYRNQDKRGLKPLYKENAYNDYHHYLGHNHGMGNGKFLAFLFSLKPQVIEQTKAEKELAQRIEVQEALVWLCGSGAGTYKVTVEKIQPYVKDYSVEHFEQVKLILKETLAQNPENK